MDRDVTRAQIEDLFRRESAHLVAALTRLLGPAQLALAEDVVHDALVTAMHAWRFGLPDDPEAWILQVAPGPVVALNRGLAVAELRGVDAGRDALRLLADEPKLAEYSFYWAARADLERRIGAFAAARTLYKRAIALAGSRSERQSYERRLSSLGN